MPDLKLVQLCDQLGYSKQSLAQQDHFIELRTKEKDGKGKLLSFGTSAYSEHINQLMAEYCGFLNQQQLECDGERDTEWLLMSKSMVRRTNALQRP